jgi:hypothetical protein
VTAGQRNVSSVLAGPARRECPTLGDEPSIPGPI